MSDVLIKNTMLEKRKHTGRMLCEDKGRDWSIISVCQRTPEMPSKPRWKLRERSRTNSPSQPTEEVNPTNNLVRDPKPPAL
jgi:hypothetical protein